MVYGIGYGMVCAVQQQRCVLKLWENIILYSRFHENIIIYVLLQESSLNTTQTTCNNVVVLNIMHIAHLLLHWQHMCISFGQQRYNKKKRCIFFPQGNRDCEADRCTICLAHTIYEVSFPLQKLNSFVSIVCHARVEKKLVYLL